MDLRAHSDNRTKLIFIIFLEVTVSDGVATQFSLGYPNPYRYINTMRKSVEGVVKRTHMWTRCASFSLKGQPGHQKSLSNKKKYQSSFIEHQKKKNTSKYDE